MNIQNKIALVIGASIESLIAIRYAKNLGLKVIAFDANPKAPGLKEADISYNEDIANPNKIIAILERDRLIPAVILPVPIGRCLNTIGALNDYYKLDGFSFEMADICTDKLKFALALTGGGSGLQIKPIKNLRNAKFKLVRPNLDISEFKFPLIVKPRFGSGSKDVIAIKDAIELENILKDSKFAKEDFIIEELINGIEYGLDAVVIDGVFHHILMRQKFITPLPYRQAIGNISTSEIPAVSKYMQEIITTLNIDNTLLNADLIITPSGEPFIIELATRPSGHYLSKFIELVTGVNPTKEWINRSLNLPYSFEVKFLKNMIIRYFDLEGECQMAEFDTLKDELGIIDYQCHISSPLGKVTDGASIMSRGYAIIEANSKEECINNAQKLISNFKRIKK